MYFAVMELKHVVPLVARPMDFELVSSPRPEAESAMTLQPSSDIRIRVHER